MGPIVERDKDPQYMSDSKKIARLLRDTLKYRKDSVIVAVTLIASSAVGMIGPYVIGLAAGSLENRDFSLALTLAAVYAAMYLGNYVAENRRTYLMPVLSQRVIMDLRNKCFESLQKVSVRYFSKRETGRIMSYITNDAEALSDFLTFQMPQVLAGLTTIVGTIAIMLYLDVKLTLIALIVIPILGGFAVSLQRKIRETYLETRRKIAMVTARLQETISGIRVIQAFAREDTSSARFDAANTENMRVNIKATKLSSFFNSTIQVIEAFGIALVLYFGTHQVLVGATTLAVLVSFVFYVQNFFNPVLQLSLFYNSYQSAMTGLDRVYRLADEKPQIDVSSSLVRLPDISGQIEFSDVSFSYEKMEVLHNVSFFIPSGKKVALVGPTGAGKSTIINLLLRFYDPTSGKILIDGHDLKQIDPVSYRKRVAVVLQEALLFSGSVLENIRLGAPELTRDQVLKKLDEYGLNDFFSTLPQGVDSVLSERGANLSDGQKQMIALARAVVRDPRIIILDEATAQLDPKTERKIQSVLEHGLSGRTVVMIAHRLSTVRIADQILYVENGQIVESGSYEQLIAKGGRFSRLEKLQFSAV
ncbi:MAG: ABC transporter ATP-binding protein [Thermoprotei archaeon]